MSRVFLNVSSSQKYDYTTWVEDPPIYECQYRIIDRGKSQKFYKAEHCKYIYVDFKNCLDIEVESMFIKSILCHVYDIVDTKKWIII